MTINPSTFNIGISTGAQTNLSNITALIQEKVNEAGTREGLCIVMTNHSTAGIIINSIMDPATIIDLVEEIDRVIPTRVDFHHTYDTPRDAAGHVKAMLIGHSISIPISKGLLNLGKNSGILFCEFDGPRERQVYIHIFGYE